MGCWRLAASDDALCRVSIVVVFVRVVAQEFSGWWNYDCSLTSRSTTTADGSGAAKAIRRIPDTG
jgi:hypothetical protein